MRAWTIALWMVLALVGVTIVAVWDASRESARALDDFAREQVTLAEALGATLGPSPRAAPAHSVEDPHSLIVLLLPFGSDAFLSTTGTRVDAPFLIDAITSEQSSLRLSREQAASLGLSRRLAMAGFAPIKVGNARGSTVVVVASAERERDRERRALWRLLLSVALAGTLVLAFGGLAFRNQRRELALQHDLQIAALQDERDRKLAVADKAATLGALATGFAHEVSTPLGVIVGRAEQLQPRLTDDKDKRAITAILEQSERISRIVRGLLGLARGDSPSFERVAASEIVMNACELVEHRFEKKGVALDVDLSGDLPTIACEPRLLEQALVNLLLNACDACAAGGHVALRARQRDARVTFAVEDDGEGITPEAATRATEAFFTTKAVGAGVGLGLAIASEIVKHHQGTLAIAARGGDTSGTIASIDLPAAGPKA